MTPLEKLIDDTERELNTLLPNLQERIKKRIHLAYLYGINEATDSLTLNPEEILERLSTPKE